MRKIRTFSLALFAAIGLCAGLVAAAPPSSVKVQVFDQRGAPVRDAVVEVRSAAPPGGRIVFPWRMAMGQKDLSFVPGTLVIAKGSTVAFPNLDRVRHSIYSFSKPAKFSIDLYGRDQTRTQAFPVSGTVALGCKIHDAMRGYIRIVETPFAGKTDSNGIVTLTGIPPGSGKLVVWHPRLRAPGGEASQTIRLAAGANTQKTAITLR